MKKVLWLLGAALLLVFWWLQSRQELPQQQRVPAPSSEPSLAVTQTSPAVSTLSQLDSEVSPEWAGAQTDREWHENVSPPETADQSAAESLHCPGVEELHAHPGRSELDTWFQQDLMFNNWSEDFFWQMGEAGMLLEAQAGNVLAMRALALYYGEPGVELTDSEQQPEREPDRHQARFWLYQAALADMPTTFTINALLFLDEANQLELTYSEDGVLPEPYFSQHRELQIAALAQKKFDLWVTPVLQQMSAGSASWLAHLEFSEDEVQQAEEQLAALKAEWRFHRSQRGQSEHIEIQMPPEVAEWFELSRLAAECPDSGR